MAEVQQAKVGIADARDLFPPGRRGYEVVRRHLMNSPAQFRASEASPAVRALEHVVADRMSMQPPLPDEVADTIVDFTAGYKEYIEGPGFGYISAERIRLEDVANELVSIVFEYGYGRDVRPHGQASHGSEM